MGRRLILAIITIHLLIITSCGTSGTIKPGSLDIAKHVTFDKDDYQKITSANNELGFKLLHHVEPDELGNIFISPTSLFMALSMLYNGADGHTKEEIAHTLQAQGIDVHELNKANASLMSALNKQSDDISLRVANSIWLNEDFHFQKDFREHTEDYFNAEIEEIDVHDLEAPKLINDWVNKATNGKIEEIVQSLNPNLVTMLINAIYLDAGWTIPFNEDLTEERPFYLEDGSTKHAPLMMLKEKLSYLENELFQAVTLTYGDNQEMSMTILLPHEQANVSDFKKIMTYENWETWNTEFSQQEGTLLLPRFQIEYDILLNEALQSLGMTTAFNEQADLSQMVEENVSLFISQVMQKTYIDVNEEGTEAAAVTSIDIEQTSAPVEEAPFYMEVNRPFLLTITDHETEAILFMGMINDPQQHDDN